MSKKNDRSVLGNLPSTRPTRMSRRREGASARAEAPVATKPATAKPAAAKRAPAKPKAAKPRPVRSGSPSLQRPPRKAPEPPRPPASSPPKGAEIVTTAVQAAGELAQIGFTLGGQVAKRALKRIPKP